MTEVGDLGVGVSFPSETDLNAAAHVGFSGRRKKLLAILLRGMMLLVPTLGLYRFWLVTRKRQFYWSSTYIDGDNLEYTGTAKQLLVGFMIAVLFFVPIYGGLFTLSLRAPDAALVGYAVVGVIIYFLMGYAIFRSRRFRLTRTLWRGIRFHQTGNAWVYALRRFGWTLLMFPTLGLAYPFMASDLWRYRIEHTWFGDRKFSFAGSWKSVAATFYGAYFISVVFAVIALMIAGPTLNEDVTLIAFVLVVTPFAPIIYFWVKSRFLSRFWSSVRLGNAVLTVKVPARSLVGLYVGYALYFILLLLVLTILTIVIFGVASLFMDTGMIDFSALLNNVSLASPALLLLAGLSYLLFIMAIGALSELILAFGFWKLLTRNIQISNVTELRGVMAAAGEESPLAGEGLADALNVGAY